MGWNTRAERLTVAALYGLQFGLRMTPVYPVWNHRVEIFRQQKKNVGRVDICGQLVLLDQGYTQHALTNRRVRRPGHVYMRQFQSAVLRWL